MFGLIRFLLYLLYCDIFLPYCISYPLNNFDFFFLCCISNYTHYKNTMHTWWMFVLGLRGARTFNMKNNNKKIIIIIDEHWHFLLREFIKTKAFLVLESQCKTWLNTLHFCMLRFSDLSTFLFLLVMYICFIVFLQNIFC